MADESDRRVRLEHSTPCRSISSLNIADETLLLSEPRSFYSSRIKQKGIKQLQTKVSTQLGILSSHKVLLLRLTVTFSRSQSQASSAYLKETFFM